MDENITNKSLLQSCYF